MKIIFEKNVLSNALAPLMGGVSNKGTIQSIEGILISTINESTCNLSSFDLEKGFNIKIKAEVKEYGSYIINGVKLNQIVKSMPSELISISVDSRLIAKIQSGKSEFELGVMIGEEFPNLPEFKSDINFKIQQGILKNMISRSVFAVSTQVDSRQELSGSLFSINKNKIKIVACDGNRLVIREQECDIANSDDEILDLKFILPLKTLHELLKLLKDNEETVNISLSHKNAVFCFGNLFFFSKLLSGEYIAYNKFIPVESKITVVANTEALISTFERAYVVSEDKSLGRTKGFVKCNFLDDIIEISSNSATGKVYDEVPVKKTGIDLEIGFNCKYLLEAVKSCGVEEVKLLLNSPLSCMLITPVENNESEKFLYLILPVKMKD